MSLRFLIRTPSGRPETASLPMVLLLHGRGADMHDLADVAPMIDTPDGCRFVLPNAPKSFEPYPGMSAGWTWFEGWPPSQESLVDSRATLLHFVDEISERYPTPDGMLVLAGFSQGAMMSLDAGLRTEKKLAGIVAMSGGLYEPDLPDLKQKTGVPLLIAHGTADQVVPVNYARRARRVLEDAGFDVEYHEYPMAHQLAQEEAAAVRAFLTRVLTS